MPNSPLNLLCQSLDYRKTKPFVRRKVHSFSIILNRNARFAWGADQSEVDPNPPSRIAERILNRITDELIYYQPGRDGAIKRNTDVLRLNFNSYFRSLRNAAAQRAEKSIKIHVARRAGRWEEILTRRAASDFFHSGIEHCSNVGCDIPQFFSQTSDDDFQVVSYAMPPFLKRAVEFRLLADNFRYCLMPRFCQSGTDARYLPSKIPHDSVSSEHGPISSALLNVLDHLPSRLHVLHQA